MASLVSILILAGVVNMASPSESELQDRLKKEPENVEVLIELGKIYHHKGIDGDKKAVKQAEGLLKKAIKLESDNVEATAWYGSLLTLKGRDASFSILRLRYVNRGIKMLDVAVKKAPNNITLRMIRANNSLGLPGFFGRLDVAITDLEYLLKLKEKYPESFSDELLSQIHSLLDQAYQRKGEKNSRLSPVPTTPYKLNPALCKDCQDR